MWLFKTTTKRECTINWLVKKNGPERPSNLKEREKERPSTLKQTKNPLRKRTITSFLFCTRCYCFAMQTKDKKNVTHTPIQNDTHTHDRSNPRRMLAQLGHTPPFGAPLLAATPPPGPASDARTFWCWNRRGGRVPPGVADVRFGLCPAHQPLYKVTSLFWLVWRERWSSGPEAFGVSCQRQRSLCAEVKS